MCLSPYGRRGQSPVNEAESRQNPDTQVSEGFGGRRAWKQNPDTQVSEGFGGRRAWRLGGRPGVKSELRKLESVVRTGVSCGAGRCGEHSGPRRGACAHVQRGRERYAIKQSTRGPCGN